MSPRLLSLVLISVSLAFGVAAEASPSSATDSQWLHCGHVWDGITAGLGGETYI